MSSKKKNSASALGLTKGSVVILHEANPNAVATCPTCKHDTLAVPSVASMKAMVVTVDDDDHLTLVRVDDADLDPKDPMRVTKARERQGGLLYPGVPRADGKPTDLSWSPLRR